MKKLTALILTILSLFTLVSCEKIGSDNYSKMTLNTTSSNPIGDETSAPVATEEEETSDPETVKEIMTQSLQDDQWKAAYKDFFSDASDPLYNYQSLCINDINRDGIPEVFIDRWGIGCPQQVVTYIKDKGIITLAFDIGSTPRITNKLYIALNQNEAILREDGNTPGSLEYHHAVVYILGNNGFEKMHEISGIELDEKFDYDDSAALDAHIKKSREFFDKEFATVTKSLNLIDYADVAVTKNIKEYLNNELKLDKS